MARDFDAVDDYITLSAPSATTAVSNNFTIAAIFRADTDQSGTTTRRILGSNSSVSGSLSPTLQRTAAEVVRLVYIDSTGGTVTASNTGATVLAADGWAFIAWTKTAGTTGPISHRYLYATDAWTQATASTEANPGTGDFTGFWLGATSTGTQLWDGQIAVAGYFQSALDISNVRSLAHSLQAWIACSPLCLYVLDQSDVAQNVVDFAGSGANQSAITGTSVATQSVPVFSYGFDVLLPSRFSAAVAGIPYLVAARRN